MTKTMPECAKRPSIDDMIETYAVQSPALEYRLLSGRKTGVHALETRNPARQIAVAGCDFHRFNLQLSGRQNLTAFRMARQRCSAPKRTGPGVFSFVSAENALTATMQGDEFRAFQLLIPRQFMRRILVELHGPDAHDDDLLGHIGAPSDALLRLGQLLHDEYRAPRGGDGVMVESLTQALCVEIIRRFAKPQVTDGPNASMSEAGRVNLLAAFEQAIDGSLSLADIAASFGVRPYKLSRMFRAEFGESPRSHLMRLRIEAARRMLRETDTPLAEIALACGFSSQSHMTTCLRKHLGATPARYRSAATAREPIEYCEQKATRR